MIRNITILLLLTFGLGQDYSLSFDGDHDYVDLHGNNTFNFGNSDFTISLWFKSLTNELPDTYVRPLVKQPITSDGYYDLFAYSNGFSVYGIEYSSEACAIFHWDTIIHPGWYGSISNINTIDENWHYITGVKEGTNLYIYIDGELNSIQIYTPPENENADNDGPLLLGSNNNSIPHLISSPEIWNRALSQSEILTNMNTSLYGNEDGLVGFWEFNGESLIDLTENGNDGTIYGATWSTDVPCGSDGIDEGACDCDGNVADECGVCEGDGSSCQILGDLNGDGTINVIDIVMAVDLILSDNYDIVGDANEDGQLNVIDIVMLVDWVLNGTSNEAGCTDMDACNYNTDATSDDGSCEYPSNCYDCDGGCICELDFCGVCGGDNVCEVSACHDGYVADCADDDCCPEAWIGDGYEDCEDQAYGCDLTCYDNDGGDCGDDAYYCGDGDCNGDETEDSCADDCSCPDNGMDWWNCGDGQCIPESYFCDGSSEFCNANWGADCSNGADEGLDICGYEDECDGRTTTYSNDYKIDREPRTFTDEIYKKKMTEYDAANDAENGSNRDTACDGSWSGSDFGCDGVCFSGIINDECGECGGDGPEECWDGSYECDALACNSTVTDIDDNAYQILQIGTQLWMASDLRVTHYNNGEEILFVPAGGQQEDYYWTTDPNYYGPKYTITPYGNHYLYNYDAVDDERGICPENWHVASNDEWLELIDDIGGSAIAGGKLKDTGTSYWWAPNTGATNETGFTARAAGCRRWAMYDSNNDGWADETFIHQMEFAIYWTSDNDIAKLLAYDSDGAYTANSSSVYGNDGLSVRCVAD